MIKILKMIGISIAVIIGLMIIVVTLFLNLSPQFGKVQTAEQKLAYSKSGHYENGKFINQNLTIMDIHFFGLIKELIIGSPNRRPKENFLVKKIDSAKIENFNADNTRLTWFGHSTFLLEMGGKIILIDPMFGKSPSPIPFLGAKRYSKELPIEIEKLPIIDAVILSHDHYDHLDYESTQKLKGKVNQYFTPLGVGNHLAEWGIVKDKITELNWWECVELDEMKLICTPARHFSGRGIFDRASTLWCSWVIKEKGYNIFFSGDSGYDEHFIKIGEKYGPFDISLMECGQYHRDWQLFHMMPEETVRASIDLKSKLLLPIHWGAFTLSLHDWTDPVERVTKKADELNMPITTPKIGEPVILGNKTYPTEKWWKNYMVENSN